MNDLIKITGLILIGIVMLFVVSFCIASPFIAFYHLFLE